MKKTWIVPCCALGMLLYAGTAQAAFWQVLRDTPVRADAAAGAKAKLYWIFSPPAAEKISHLRFLKMISLLNT